MEKTILPCVSLSSLKKHLHGRGEDCQRRCQVSAQARNTSTDVEKTFCAAAASLSSWKHLHGRGEDYHGPICASAERETPPRTWRRLQPLHDHDDRRGNTSTDVEKTGRIETYSLLHEETPPRTWRRLFGEGCEVEGCQKHLHGRGEDSKAFLVALVHLETPPRTWRRLSLLWLMQLVVGNTSTDVEKTPSSKAGKTPAEKHLHGRGEDNTTHSFLQPASETPPRTWRRQLRCVISLSFVGNTSTDVEKTFSSCSGSNSGKKHLHGRGEDQSRGQVQLVSEETPPRTWRRQ